MANILELKDLIDLHDLASRLGLERPGSHGNYKSPKHDDKSPSLGIHKDNKHWRDYSDGSGKARGSCIDLVMHVRDVDASEAIKILHDMYGIETDPPANQPYKEKSLAEFIANRCLSVADQAMNYLVDIRKIPESVVSAAIKARSIGFNTYINEKRPSGELGYGGPAVAFIVRTPNPGHVAAVDLRYIDPALNGNCKTQTQGEKFGLPWTSDLKRLKNAHTVYLVESAINALSVEAAFGYGYAALAIRGTANASLIEYTKFLTGKQVLICMDNDPIDERGNCPGKQAAWAALDACNKFCIASHFVDQKEWLEPGYNDINDILIAEGHAELGIRLKRTEQWLIPGQAGNEDAQVGPRRIYLPPHDFAQYWRYRVKNDFTTYVKKASTDDDGQEKQEFQDVCGFRVASISRVNVAPASSVMTGEPGLQPKTSFAVTVQLARHENNLIRKVFDDAHLHNADQWQRLGPVFSRSQFLRMINILERSAAIGARSVVNFVGLAWLDGKLVVNDGADCYFTDPEKQCPYHNLEFPSGSVSDARTVIAAYQKTFKNNAAGQLLIWALGGHLKAFLGFWPHMIMQAEKSVGKTTLSKRLERTLNFTMFSGQSLNTEFRLLTSISHTSQPVGWEELSARRQDIIDKAVSLLQESYNYGITRRGSDMTEYLLCAPVLLVGEDVPVPSLLSKVLRTALTKRARGPMLSESLPRFPVREWLQFLSKFTRESINKHYQDAVVFCTDNCCAAHHDAGAQRIVDNYAALLTTWRLVCDFASLEPGQGGFERDLLSEMNRHITETKADRQPWVWIIDILFNEISSGRYRYPFKFKEERHEGEPIQVLLIRPTHVMSHISSEIALREKWNGLTVKTARVLKQQLKSAGVLFSDAEGRDRFDIQIKNSRECHLSALSLPALEAYGLSVGVPNEVEI